MPDQTVYRFVTRNGIEGLQAFREPIPQPAPDEVVVSIRSVALNYRDIAIANSTYPLPVKDNVVPTSDMSGRVVEVGERAKALFAVNDAVLAPVNPLLLYGSVNEASVEATLGGLVDGTLREYIALPAHALIKIPKKKSDLSFAQWASLPGVGSTVWNSFYGSTPLRPGSTVLLQGTGGVSMAGLIFAKAAGATTIITSSSDEKLAYAKSKFGADHTINYKTTPDWAAEVNRITDGRGADHILEVGGLGTLQQSLSCIAFGGIISLIGFLSAAGDKPLDWLIPTISRAVVIRGILAGSKQQLEEAVQFVASRNLPLPVDKTFGFSRDEILDALRYVATGKHIGKVCIQVRAD